MKRVLATVFLVLAAPSLWAADVVIEGQRKVKPGEYAELAVKATAGDQVSWQVLPEPPKKTVRDGLLIFALKPGVEYTAGVTVVNFEKKSLDQGTATVAFDGGLPPVPVPPGPEPTPTPPTPTPTPSPAPIPVAGFRVLFVEETADRAKLPAAQLNAMFDKRVIDYLNAKCVAGPDGRTKEWRRWDKDWNASTEPKLWQDAFARPRAGVPWVVASNGTTGYEGSWTDTADLLAKLKKVGGE